MESTVLSVGKSVLSGAISYVKSTIAEEVALQLGIRRDHAFIRDELEMMQAFLLAAHEEPDEHKVIMTWVKQVRNVAYDVEDCLQDFAICLGKHSWWRTPCTLIDRHYVSIQMKELRSKIEDVSQRNVRYRLIEGSSSKATNIAGLSSTPGATMSGIDEVMRLQNKAKVGLIQLISKEDLDLRVIAVWGAIDVLEDMPIIEMCYDYLKRIKKFECYAWIHIKHPFNRTEFLQNIIRQFYIDSLEDTLIAQLESTPGALDLRRMGMMKEDDLVFEFKKFVNMKSYMIVLRDMSTIEEWDQIKTCFQNSNKGSRLLVCTKNVEVASLCVGPETVLPNHKKLSTNHTLYAFYEKDSQDGTDSMGLGSNLNKATIENIHSMVGNRVIPINTEEVAYKESQLIGREKEKSDIIKLIVDKGSQQLEVISVCGMGGLGKTTLVKDVYQSQELSAMFEKRACATIMRPFHLEELFSSLAMQLDEMSYRHEKATDGDRTELGVKQSLTAGPLEGKRYLIVLDDLSSTTEWDAIIEHFPITKTASRIIVTTRVEKVAKHCSKKDNNICMLKSLAEKDARDLFTEKVFGNITDLDEQYPELVEEANCILKKCDGLPLAIVTIGGFLEKQPKTPVEWRKLNRHISAELEMNPELGMIKNILLRSYDGLPFHLKSCFLYLSIFPAGYMVGRMRLIRRWTAEGYSRQIRDKSAERIANSYFKELIDRRMVLPSHRYIYISKGIDSCKIHDLMREIAVSKSADEDLVLRLEEGCSPNTHGVIRHLAINSTWKGGKIEFESMVDLSRIRSLTVFGKWQPFFISKKMRLLRVLDLEGTLGLLDHHLEHIGNLLHLVYLSLRQCEGILHLPGSVGNLRQLQTLDVIGTRIIKLPSSITKLRKLRFIRSGNDFGTLHYRFHEEFIKDKVQPAQNKRCLLPLSSVCFCASCCTPQLMRDAVEVDGIPNRHDVCNIYSCIMPPFFERQLDARGVVFPTGIRKLKALDTLGIVNIAQRKTILKDIRSLTQLRKLEVIGVNKKNCREFCLVLSDLSCLLALLVSVMEPGLYGCLDGVSSPPKNLGSLHLVGSIVKLPEWTKGLQNLEKLKLRSTMLCELDASMQVIGGLPNLKILCLWHKSFEVEELCLSFQQVVFQSLEVLELARLDSLKSVKFEEGAMPKLEQLFFAGWQEKINTVFFSGLASLQSFKEFLLYSGEYKEDFVEDVRAQLGKNPNGPVLKRY